MIALNEIKELFPGIESMPQETWHPDKAYRVLIDNNAEGSISYYSELNLYLYRESDDSDKEIGLCLDDGSEQVAWCWVDIEELDKDEPIDFLQYCTVLREIDYTF